MKLNIQIFSLYLLEIQDICNHKLYLSPEHPSGFGKITAQMLSAQGHIVYGTSRKLSEDMNEVKMLVVDVTNSPSIRQAIDRILSEPGTD